jgi:heme/copper-type cytochrome/quinol oxidase subunit 2
MSIFANQLAAAAVSSTVELNPLTQITSLSTLFTFITNAIIIVGLFVVIVFLALGFIAFVTSQGDKVKTEQAQKWVTYAVLGGVGLLAVYAIRAVILSLTGATTTADLNSY